MLRTETMGDGGGEVKVGVSLRRARKTATLAVKDGE